MNYWPEYVKSLKLAAVSKNFAAFRLEGDPFLPPVPGDATLSVGARMKFPRNGGEEWFPQDLVIPLYTVQKIICSATRVMIDGVDLAVKPNEQYVIVDARYAAGLSLEESYDAGQYEDDSRPEEYPDEYEEDDQRIVLTVPVGTHEILIRFED